MRSGVNSGKSVLGAFPWRPVRIAATVTAEAMKAREIVAPRAFTGGSLVEAMKADILFPRGWESLPGEVLVDYLKREQCEEGLLRELRWHVKEVRHLNEKRTWLLQIPFIGRQIRDQHEINRLLLISLEMSLDLAGRAEQETARLSRDFSEAGRSDWHQGFRYMGRQWSRVRMAEKALRDQWERGRSPYHRLRSKAGQRGINPWIDAAVRGLSEITTCLFETMKSPAFQELLSGDEKGSGTFLPELESHLEICRWHAREAAALLQKTDKLWPPVRKIVDWQSRLNRLYRIALEENTWLLVELSELLSRAMVAKAGHSTGSPCA